MNSLDSLKSSIISQFGTPCAVIDLDIIKKNILRAQKICDAAGVANRPHIKTHKSPLLAKMQIDAGARGITCQKLGEAKVMAEYGKVNGLKENKILDILMMRIIIIQMILKEDRYHQLLI